MAYSSDEGPKVLEGCHLPPVPSLHRTNGSWHLLEGCGVLKGCKKNIVSESQTQALQAGSEGTALFFQPEAEGLGCIPEATVLRLCPLSWWNLGVVCLKSPRNIRIYNPSLPCNGKQGSHSPDGRGSLWAPNLPLCSLLPWVFLPCGHPSKDGALWYKVETFGRNNSLAHRGTDRHGPSPLCLGATKDVCSVTIQ